MPGARLSTRRESYQRVLLQRRQASDSRSHFWTAGPPASKSVGPGKIRGRGAAGEHMRLDGHERR